MIAVEFGPLPMLSGKWDVSECGEDVAIMCF